MQESIAVGYYQTGNLHQSESLCKQIVRKKPNHVDALNLLGLVCYCLANYDCAMDSALDLEDKACRAIHLISMHVSSSN